MDSMTATIISIANQKGGVGKTTSTVNLARALVDSGQRVLIIDCDPQSSLSIVHGIDPRQLRELDAAGKTLYHGLVKDTPLELLVTGSSPALIPASIRLANAETELVSPFGVAGLLKEKITTLREHYDVILIDCPPTLSLLTVNALTASDAVVIPCKTDYLSIMGIPLLIETIDNVRRRANPNLKVIGILPTMFNARAGHDAEALQELKNSVASKNITVFDPVHRSTSFDKANVEAKSALELFPDTAGIQQYKIVANTIIQHYAA
jgi:chromosome partitioning protein